MTATATAAALKHLLLIDLSSIAHPIYHTSSKEPDPNWTSTQIVSRVRALATGQDHVIICCDSGKSFRVEIDPTYKANRPERDEILHHQIKVAIEQLERDGFPVWKIPGYEADDLIATACAHGLAHGPEVEVTVCSADKDLLQLVGDRVNAKHPLTGNLADVAGVTMKLGVPPHQVRDYLTLVGDASDNVKGCPKVGPKTASELLGKFGSIENIYAAIDAGELSFTPALRTNLVGFREQWPTTRQLISLRMDAPIKFEQVLAGRTPVKQEFEEQFSDWGMGDADEALPIMDGPVRRPAPTTGEAHDNSRSGRASQPTQEAEADPAHRADGTRRMDHRDPVQAETRSGPGNGGAQDVSGAHGDVRRDGPGRGDLGPAHSGLRGAGEGGEGSRPLTGEIVNGGTKPHEPQQALVRQTDPLTMPPDWGHALEPRSVREAISVSERMFASRLFSQFGTPEAVLSTIMAGRELGMPSMASLRAFHVIEGKPTLSAGAIQALVINSGKAKYFRCTERTAEKATFTTQRGDDPPFTLTYTVQEAKQAWTKNEDGWNKSGWGKNPADMCVARAATKLARLVYPDVVLGVYAREEFE